MGTAKYYQKVDSQGNVKNVTDLTGLSMEEQEEFMRRRASEFEGINSCSWFDGLSGGIIEIPWSILDWLGDYNRLLLVFVPIIIFGFVVMAWLIYSLICILCAM